MTEEEQTTEEEVVETTALTAAIDELLGRKPHLAARRVSGDVGQGAGSAGFAVDLAGLLRRNAS